MHVELTTTTPLRSDSLASTARSFRIKSYQSIADAHSCCEISEKSIDNMTLLQPRNVKRDRLRAKLDNLSTRSRAMRLESLESSKKSVSRLSDLCSKTSVLNLSSAVTPKQNKSKDLAAKFSNKPLDIFIRKKKTIASERESRAELTNLSQYISASKELKNPFETQASIIARETETSAKQQACPEKFKLNSFFRKHTSILLNHKTPKAKHDSLMPNDKCEESPRICQSQVTVVKFGLKPAPAQNITESVIVEEPQQQGSRSRSRSKQVNEYMQEYANIVNKSRASSLNRSLIPKMILRSSIDKVEMPVARIRFNSSQTSTTDDANFNRSIVRARVTSEYINDVSELERQVPKIPEQPEVTQSCFFAKKAFRSNKVYLQMSKPDTLQRNESTNDSKAQRITEALVEVNAGAEEPMLLDVHESHAKLVQYIAIGHVSARMSVRSIVDELDAGFAIAEMIWFTDDNAIKGFQAVYVRQTDDKRRYGLLHGCISNFPVQLKIAKGDKLSTIYFYAENGALKSLKLLTTHDDVFTVGAPLEDADDLDGIQSIEISAQKCLTHVTSYFNDDNGNLAKLQLTLS